MYNKVYKGFQVNLGTPFQVRTPINFHTIGVKEEMGQDTAANEPADTSPKPEDILASAHEEAELIIKEAELESARIMEDVINEVKERCAQLEEDARRSGYEEGVSEGRKQYEDLISEAEMIREQARMEYDEILASLEKDALELIMDIARKVIGAEITVNRENMLLMVKQAFDRCSNKEGMHLRVSPEDYEFICENKEKLLAISEGVGDLEIKKDLSLKAGACIVDTPFGSLDAGVQTKLKKIEDAFREVIGK